MMAKEIFLKVISIMMSFLAKAFIKHRLVIFIMAIGEIINRMVSERKYGLTAPLMKVNIRMG